MRWNRVIGLAILALMLIPSFGVALAEDIIDVWTDEDSYELGENVEVEGYTNVTETVTITITNSTGHEILSLTDDPEDDEFSAHFELDEDFAEGTYVVNATVGDIYKTTSFEVDVEADDEEDDDNPGEVHTLEELLCAIDRAFRYIDKVNSTANALDEEGYNVTYFWDTLDELNGTLTELRYKITEEGMPLEEATEIFSDLRGDLGRLYGLLHSSTKKVREEKAEKFIEHMEKLINSTIERIERFETDDGEKLRGALEAQRRKLWRLRLTLNATNVDDAVNTLEDVTEGIDGSLTEFDSEGFSLKAMYKLQARIDVFNATVERMEEKGKDMHKLQEKLRNARALMNQMESQFGEQNWELNWGKMKGNIDDANESLKGVGKTIREMNKSNKGGNGKSNGNKKGN